MNEGFFFKSYTPFSLTEVRHAVLGQHRQLCLVDGGVGGRGSF